MGQILSCIFRFIKNSLCGRQDDDEEETEEDLYTQEHDSVFISTPELLESLNSTFKLYQNQNVLSTCIEIVEENGQAQGASASARVLGLGVDNLVQTQHSCPETEKWVRHYCNSHKMLLVGEGDFSFSASLAIAFGSATNMVATSLDSRGFLFRNYKKAMSNIHELRSRGCTVLHDVDATEMANHFFLRGIKYDRIIYNFPHAGFCADEPGHSQKRRHQVLISLFFKNAKEMMDENGEIHVTHKSNGFFLDWNIKGIASALGLMLIQEVPFRFSDYPGYRTKYGFGGDKNFNCNPSKTYKFGLLPAASP